MAKKDTYNFISLIAGIILIFIGLAGVSLTISTRNLIIILPTIALIVGAFLALMGGLRKW